MNTPVRRIIVGMAFLALTCIAAVTGYVLAGWDVLDAVFMVVITVFGVGYGETRPLATPELKIFTMGLVIAGCSAAIYVVGGFVQMLAEGEINRVLGSRRMSKGIELLTDHAILCGFGRVGQVLAQELASAHYPFVVVDTESERVERAQADGYLTLLGSASDEHTLNMAGIDRARVLATVLPSDTSNVFVALTARELNASIQIIARAETPATEKKLYRAGANRVILPAVIGAAKIAHYIVRPSAEDLLFESAGAKALNEDLQQVGLELSELEVAAGSPLVGQTVGDVETGSGGFVLVAIKRPNGTLVRAIDAAISIGAGDVLVIMGHREAMPNIERRTKPVNMTYRGATV
jgi:voltage-gated potassium channel